MRTVTIDDQTEKNIEFLKRILQEGSMKDGECTIKRPLTDEQIVKMVIDLRVIQVKDSRRKAGLK